DLNEETIERYIVWLMSRLPSMETVKQRRSYIVALWNWCARQRLVEKFPCIQPVEVPEKVPDAWTAEQLSLLLRHLGRVPGYIGGVRACDGWVSIRVFWFFEGERLSATLAAEWCNYAGGTLIIPCQDRKGRRKTAVYHCHEDVVAWLEKIRQPAR